MVKNNPEPVEQVMKQWYLLYCKRGGVTRAQTNLENQQVECWFPQFTVKKNRKGKLIEVQEPLFPSYLFVRFEVEFGPTLTAVRSTSGVADFVRLGRKPVVIHDQLINNLKKRTQFAQIQELFKPGEKAQLINGQYSGLEVIFQYQYGEERSMVLITLLNRQHQIQVDNNDLCPLD